MSFPHFGYQLAVLYDAAVGIMHWNHSENSYLFLTSISIEIHAESTMYQCLFICYGTTVYVTIKYYNTNN